MLRKTIFATVGAIGLLLANEASAQTAFPSVRPGYNPNFQYRYGYGVYPSYYYNPNQVVQPRPQARIYTIEFRRSHFDYWRVFGRTYSAVEAQNYTNYLRRLGFDARVHTHPLL